MVVVAAAVLEIAHLQVALAAQVHNQVLRLAVSETMAEQDMQINGQAAEAEVLAQ